MQEIDLDVEDLDLREAMDLIGRKVGRNILVDPTINERVTIALQAIPWRDAVDVIARMTKCEVEERGSIIILTQSPDVTLQFHGVNVRTALQIAATHEGRIVCISPLVSGTVTIHRAGIRAPIQAVAEAAGLEYVREGGCDRVFPREGTGGR